MSKSSVRALAAMLALLTAPLALFGGDTPGKTRLFILSGQSNMKHLEPEVSFTPKLKQLFPDDEIIVIKLASSGQPISRWYRDWKPLDAEPEKGQIIGDLYAKLMKEVTAALEGKPKPDTVSFIWMQGEADTASPSTAGVYAESLRGLIAQVRDDLARPDTYAVIGRISDYAEHPEGSRTIREAQMAVVKADPLTAWIDTDDLNGKRDDLHYTLDGYKQLGDRFAEKAAELIKAGKKPN